MHDMVRKWPYFFFPLSVCSRPYVCCTFRAKPVLSKQLLISAWAMLLIITFLCTSQILFRILSHNLWKVKVYNCCRVSSCRGLKIICVQSLWLLWMQLELVREPHACCRGSSRGSEGAAVFAKCPAAREGPLQVLAECPVQPHPQQHHGLGRQK